ncbi:hypothetical protein BCY80_10140 [Yersinia pestis]|nr:hypothetical protein A8V49_07490 [Yersinia pestis]PVF67020.1 hypothetical protein BCY80_10140 [Yersinia pestis]QOW15690.1 hypothetical protein S96127_3388 [Yersinia pestis]
MPLTSIEIGLLLANRQPSQNGAEFYFNGCCFVKHHSKLKQARPCDVAPAFTKKVGARSATAADYILNRAGDRINQHFFHTESFSAIRD